jgi:hypothetical protein
VHSVPNSGQSELTDCQVYAAQTVPANTQVGQNPTYVTPTNTNCYAIGTSVTCSQTGGNVYGGDVYSYDANAPLRQSVITNCMNKKGYFYISLPECKTDDIKNGLPNYSVLPALAANACVAKSPSGFVFVNP